MNPMELFYLMVATIRAGKSGTTAKAWAEASEEVLAGWSILLANRPYIEGQLAKLMELAEAKEHAATNGAKPAILTPASGLVVS